MTAPLLTADRCPSCAHAHGTHPEHPSCPRHGHYLHQLSVSDDGFTYACPAHRCTYTRTQREKATMTTDPSAALAIRGNQDFWTAKQQAALGQLFQEMPPNADLAVFLHRCQVTGLDPFANQIAMIKRGGQWKIQTEIDGFRVIRDRAAKRDGVTVSYGRTKWCDHDRNWYEEWIDEDPPAACEMTVYVDRRPFPAQIRFGAFAVRLKDGTLSHQWRTMGDHMIAKCAEAQALRKAFPQDLEGMTVAEENGGRPAPQRVTVAQVDRTPDPHPEPQPVDAQTLHEAIGNELGRIGIDDEDERAVYVYQLADKEHGTRLDAADLDKVLTLLADCETLEHIQEIIGPAT